MWKRMRLSDVDIPNNVQKAPGIVLISAGDTSITDIELFPIDIVANSGIRFRVSTGATGGVLVSMGRYQVSRHIGEARAPDSLVASASEYIRRAAAEPDRAYVSNGCGSAPDETGGGAPFDA